MKKILIITGTRPNFIKVTQFRKVASLYPGVEIKIAHTGQHYDTKMADVFFDQFDMQPDFFFNISHGSPNTQMGEIMIALEKLIQTIYTPDVLLVVGDVNSTLAASITGNKMNLKLAHLESGLRSKDRTMPEEFNRVITDYLSDLFFITEQSGWDNLIKEGADKKNMFLVGNTMIDTLIAFEDQIQACQILNTFSLTQNNFVLMTMHRPSNVDDKANANNLFELIIHIAKNSKVVFPVHPRTLQKFKEHELYADISSNKNIILCDPLDYFSFQKLIAECKYILTDSGGIQEESTYRKKPCLTIRPNTERPSTVSLGTNTLVNFNIKEISELISQIENGSYKKGEIPPLWDGKSTQRIVEIINTII